MSRYTKMTVIELKQELGQRGLKKTGNKKELIARLQAVPPPKRTLAGRRGQKAFASAKSSAKKTAGKKKKTASKKTSSKRIPARSYKSARSASKKRIEQKKSPFKK